MLSDNFFSLSTVKIKINEEPNTSRQTIILLLLFQFLLQAVLSHSATLVYRIKKMYHYCNK